MQPPFGKPGGFWRGWGGGETLWNAVNAQLNTTPGRHFWDLLCILHEFFTETLSNLHTKVTKIKKIHVDPPTNQLVATPPVTINEIKRCLNLPDKTDISQGLCFTCGNAGHIMQDCKQKQLRTNPGPNCPNFAPVPPNLSLPCHDQTCSLHPLGIHTNGACYQQQQIACKVQLIL